MSYREDVKYDPGVDPKDVEESLDEAQMVADDGKTQELPEAPASMTMRVWIQGYGVMLTVRDNKVASLLKKTETMIDYAKSHGWKDKWNEDATSQPTTSQMPSEDLGTCKKCGAPNKRSLKGKIYCSAKCWLTETT